MLAVGCLSPINNQNLTLSLIHRFNDHTSRLLSYRHQPAIYRRCCVPLSGTQQSSADFPTRRGKVGENDVEDVGEHDGRKLGGNVGTLLGETVGQGVGAEKEVKKSKHNQTSRNRTRSKISQSVCGAFVCVRLSCRERGV
jgi:hypothetical protein